MPSDFQVIRGSMVGENRRSPASTETRGLSVFFQGHFVTPPKHYESLTVTFIFSNVNWHKTMNPVSFVLSETGNELSKLWLHNITRKDLNKNIWQKFSGKVTL